MASEATVEQEQKNLEVGATLASLFNTVPDVSN